MTRYFSVDFCPVIKYSITTEYQYFKAMTKTGTRLPNNEFKNELCLLKC